MSNSELIAKLITGITLGFTLGGIGSIVLTPIFCLLRRVFYVPLVRDRFLRKAKERGYVVTAKRIESSDSGVYQFEYDGAIHKYYHKSHNLPRELTLYFIWNPHKACTSDRIGLNESNWAKYFLIIAFVISIVVTYAFVAWF